MPAPTGLLHRPRLCDAVSQGLTRRLTLISAPAGYGKTTALVDFSHHIAAPVCWYTLDERDRDLSLFVRYILAAIKERFPAFGQTTREALASRGADVSREPSALVAELANEMLDIGQDFVLVLDSFESVDGALGIREFVHRLLEVLPSNCHLMIGSRVLPDVPVTRLVAKRQLVGITEQHLRFRPDEIRRLLERSQIDVSEEQTRAIATHAEGWITGILLISDLLREDAGWLLADVEEPSALTYGYLASEVLARQPPDVRRFLRTSSVLREMSSWLCREVLEIERAPSLLTEVERRNLFLTRFGDDRSAVYRYHPLFRDFLTQRLREEEPARYEDLHRRAGAWFQESHDVEESVYHYLAAEAYSEATTVIERVVTEWFTRGRVETVLGWATSLPEGIRSEAPLLALYESRALTDRYDYEGAREALAFAEAGFVERGDEVRLAKVHDQRATLALFQGRYEDAIAEAERALQMLPPEEVLGRAGATRLVGTAQVARGCAEEGVRELKEALALFREAGSPYDVLNVLQDLGFGFASQGRLDEAVVHLGDALPLARRLGSSSHLAGALNILGWIHGARGNYREALDLYEEGLAAARRADDPRNEANIAEGMAGIYRDLGDYRRAELLYDVAWRIASSSRPGLAVLILAARADMCRWQGDYAGAMAVLEQAQDLAEKNGLEAERRGLLAQGMGIVLAERGEVDRGLELLSDSARFFEEREAQRDLARAQFLIAKAHCLAGEEQQAAGALKRAFARADEVGTNQFAIVEGQHARELLQLGVAEGVAGCRDLLEQTRRLSVIGRELVEGGREGGRETDGHLKIWGFGGGRVARDGRTIPSSHWKAAMAKELFFYVLLHGPVERDVAGAVFWPDLSSGKVASNFHSTLYRVRQAVGSDAVVVEGGKYAVGVDYWFDVQEFETTVERARLLPRRDWQALELWRRAVDLYQGDLLPEVNRSWCVPRRESIRGEYIEALVELARCHEERGALAEAADWYQRALEEDRFREDVHRRLIHAYAEDGRRSDALAQYEECCRVLEQELGVEPATETRKLYEEVTGRMTG